MRCVNEATFISLSQIFIPNVSSNIFTNLFNIFCTHIFDIIFSDKNSWFIAINMFQEFAIVNFAWKIHYRAIKIYIEYLIEKHFNLFSSKNSNKIRTYCIIRGIFINKSISLLKISMNLISTLIYHICSED